MADQTKPTKDQDVDSTLMSADDLDRLIAEDDPEFKSRVDQINSESAAADLNIELIDLDQILVEQEARSLKSRIRMGVRRIRNLVMGVHATIWHWLREDVSQGVLFVWRKSLAGLAILRERLRQFGFKPMKYKLTVVGFFIFAGAVMVVLWVGLTRGFVPQGRPLFIKSIGEIANGSWDFDPATEREVFYDSFRAAQNIFVIQRMIVNLRPSSQSGSNPMAMAEIFVEGISPDVIVEIKDREIEFKDAMLRTMEDFSYDELISESGKRALTERLGREADRLATQGRVRRVYLRNFVIKP